MPNAQHFKLPKEQILNMRLLTVSGRIMVKILLRTGDDRTPGGIYKHAVEELEYDAAAHIERWGEVVKVPDSLIWRPGKQGSMPWKTTMQLQIGDLVYYDYLDLLNGIVYIDEDDGTLYPLISYENAYVATRGDQIIPLNGFHLFERVQFDWGLTTLYLKDKVDTNYGKVKYVAELNKKYEGDSYNDIPLKEGDKVLFTNPYEVMLEDSVHAKFDGGKMYRRAQSKDVLVVWRGDEILLNKNVIIAEKKDNKGLRASGIQLVNTDEMYVISNCFMSSIEYINVGDKIYYGKESGIEITINGVKYVVLRPNQIIGYEEQ
jgi:co-chaperonin GroES (HSP10)